MISSKKESFKASRHRMQEQHDHLARLHAEKLKKAEEQKRQEKIRRWECIQRGSSFRSPETTNDCNVDQRLNVNRGNCLREKGYDPLMESGGRTCFQSLWDISDPDILSSMEESLEASRRRMQEQHDHLARLHAEKLKKAEEQKRREKLRKCGSIQSGSNRADETTNDSNIKTTERSLKVNRSNHLHEQDYNPLMGSGGRACFRQ